MLTGFDVETEALMRESLGGAQEEQAATAVRDVPSVEEAKPTARSKAKIALAILAVLAIGYVIVRGES